MNVEHLWNNAGGKKIEVLGENVCQYHFVYHIWQIFVLHVKLKLVPQREHYAHYKDQAVKDLAK